MTYRERLERDLQDPKFRAALKELIDESDDCSDDLVAMLEEAEDQKSGNQT